MADAFVRITSVETLADAKNLPYGAIVLYKRNLYLVDECEELIPLRIEDAEEEQNNMPDAICYHCDHLSKDFLEEQFVEGAKECSSPEDILNWYRNLYYKEAENTEHRIVAEALNEFFVKKLPKLLKETKIAAADAADASTYSDLKNAIDRYLILYGDVIQSSIERYMNEVKNDKM